MTLATGKRRTTSPESASHNCTCAVSVAPRLRRLSPADGSQPETVLPWFIGFFVLAAVARALAPPGAIRWFDAGARAGRTALVLTLFLIGANLTRDKLRAVGMRPFLHGLVLWILVGTATLAAVVFTVNR